MYFIRLLLVSCVCLFSDFIPHTPVTNDINDTTESVVYANLLPNKFNSIIKPFLIAYSPFAFLQNTYRQLFFEIKLRSRRRSRQKRKSKDNKRFPRSNNKQQKGKKEKAKNKELKKSGSEEANEESSEKPEPREDEKERKGPRKAPHCGACEEPETTIETPNKPPEIKEDKGKPKQVDTTNNYCPNKECEYYGWLSLGNIIANGRPNRGRSRQLKCKVCKKCFMETQGTIFYGKKTDPKIIWQVITALAEGVGLQAASRIFKIKVETISKWLQEAARHAEAVNNYLLHEVEVQQVQLDELWSLVGSKEAGETRTERARWVWCAIDADHKLWLNFVVGDRSEANAQLLIHGLLLILAPECIPLFLSDGLAAYANALLRHYGEWVNIPRKHKKGRSPKARFCALPRLIYAQVVKKRVGRKMVSVSQRVIYGSKKAVEKVLITSVGNVINTAFIERFNLSIRQHVAALGRKVQSLAKSEKGLISELALFQMYYNFCLPHGSLRKELTTKGNQKWQKQTPGMSAGLTSRVWSLEEMMMMRVPPWRQEGWQV